MDTTPGATIPGAINFAFVLIFTGPEKNFFFLSRDKQTEKEGLRHRVQPKTHQPDRHPNLYRRLKVRCRPSNPRIVCAVAASEKRQVEREILHGPVGLHPLEHRVRARLSTSLRDDSNREDCEQNVFVVSHRLPTHPISKTLHFCNDNNDISKNNNSNNHKCIVMQRGMLVTSWRVNPCNPTLRIYYS